KEVRIAGVDRKPLVPVVAPANAGPDAVCIRQAHGAVRVRGWCDLIADTGPERPIGIVLVLAAERKEPSIPEIERQARTGRRTGERHGLNAAPVGPLHAGHDSKSL